MKKWTRIQKSIGLFWLLYGLGLVDTCLWMFLPSPHEPLFPSTIFAGLVGFIGVSFSIDGGFMALWGKLLMLVLLLLPVVSLSLLIVGSVLAWRKAKIRCFLVGQCLELVVFAAVLSPMLAHGFSWSAVSYLMVMAVRALCIAYTVYQSRKTVATKQGRMQSPAEETGNA